MNTKTNKRDKEERKKKGQRIRIVVIDIDSADERTPKLR